MISKGKSKTVIEKKWLEQVVDFAMYSDWLSGMYYTSCNHPNQFQIDHLLGAQAKRKVDGVTTKVGEFVIMPIPIELHDITSNHPLNRTLKPRAYRDRFGHELSVWNKMPAEMENEGYELPFSKDLIDAVVMR
jgi:hypothetical protein